jgi:hypothetical protein
MDCKARWLSEEMIMLKRQKMMSELQDKLNGIIEANLVMKQMKMGNIIACWDGRSPG